MNAFKLLFVLLISAAGVFSETVPLSRDVMKLATKIEENLVKIKSLECREPHVPKKFEPHCQDFLKEYDLTYKDCFCHHKETFGHHWCHCCEDRAVVSDLVYGLYKMGQLNEFDSWAIEASLVTVGVETGACEIVHLDDSLWELGASKVEDVNLDGDEKRLLNFYNCDRSKDLEKYALVACRASRREDFGRSESEDYYHFETA